MTDALTILVVGLITSAAWGSLWWRMGRMEGKMNGSLQEWKSLKRLCPLCTLDPKGK